MPYKKPNPDTFSILVMLSDQTRAGKIKWKQGIIGLYEATISINESEVYELYAEYPQDDKPYISILGPSGYFWKYEGYVVCSLICAIRAKEPSRKLSRIPRKEMSDPKEFIAVLENSK